jgi:hypothetical protein
MTASNATPPAQPESDGGLRTIYWVLIGVLLVLAVIGLITYSGKKDDQEAKDKAAELTQKFEAAGLRVPQDQDIITRTLGSDGGVVCDDPGSSFGKALLFDQLTNGASQVGKRPILADSRVVRGELLILDTYCPDKLPGFRDKIKDLDFDDVIKN